MVTGVIIQARMQSQRLPGKVLMDLGGQPVLARVIQRSQVGRAREHVIVATSSLPADDGVAAYCAEQDVPCFRGSESDVLGRFVGAAALYGLDTIVRVTADNPLVGPDVIDDTLKAHAAGGGGVSSTFYSRTFPNGTVISVLDRVVLDHLASTATDPRVREHIIPNLDALKGLFPVNHVAARPEWTAFHLRYCLDEARDLELLRAMFATAGEAIMDFDTAQIIAFLRAHPEITAINRELGEAGY